MKSQILLHKESKMRKWLLFLSVSILFTISLQAFEIARGEREKIDLENLPNSAYYAGKIKIKIQP